MLHGVMTDWVVVLEVVVPLSYLVEVLSDVVVETLAIDIGVEVLADMNVTISAAVMTALELPMPILLDGFSC